MVSKAVANERNPQIVARWVNDHYSLKEIAFEFDLTPAGVRSILINEGAWTEYNHQAVKAAQKARKKANAAAARLASKLADPAYFRNQEILSLWNSGTKTLDEIGANYGLTRERVRQIVRQLGGKESAEIRGARGANKDAALRAEIDAFASEIVDLLKTLQKQNRPINAIRDSLKALHPKVSDAVIDGAIKKSGLKFKKYDADPFFTDEAVRTAVWHAVGRVYKQKATQQEAVAEIPATTITEITNALTERGVSALAIQEALQFAAGGKIFARENVGTTLTHMKYESVRAAFIDDNTLDAGKGSMLWPPTRQTVMKRLSDNSWADSLQGMGLGKSKGGRAKGQLIYSSDDYAAAIRDFLAHCEVYKVTASYDRYGEWVITEKASHRLRPSGASVRNIFKSWTAAVQAQGDPDQVGILSPGTGS